MTQPQDVFSWFNLGTSLAALDAMGGGTGLTARA
jgi:hypothetical protein